MAKKAMVLKQQRLSFPLVHITDARFAEDHTRI